MEVSENMRNSEWKEDLKYLYTELQKHPSLLAAEAVLRKFGYDIDTNVMRDNPDEYTEEGLTFPKSSFLLEGVVRMNIILTSSLGGSIKVNGKRIPSVILTDNDLLNKLKKLWVEDSKVMIICASPNDFERNDSICACLREAFPMSGLSISYIETCDDRNEKMIEKLPEMDVILLAGGHVPTQNSFMKKIRLKERLIGFKGLLIAWSAGSMNCASNVYAAPEAEGEAVDTSFDRWISGLGLTEINILPHYQTIKDDYLDGLRVIEDITYGDSYTHEILAMNDGSYITIENGTEILHGETYRIKNGNLEMICRNGEVLVLKE